LFAVLASSVALSIERLQVRGVVLDLTVRAHVPDANDSDGTVDSVCLTRPFGVAGLLRASLPDSSVMTRR
jgi:hypothetical protein